MYRYSATVLGRKLRQRVWICVSKICSRLGRDEVMRFARNLSEPASRWRDCIHARHPVGQVGRTTLWLRFVHGPSGVARRAATSPPAPCPIQRCDETDEGWPGELGSTPDDGETASGGRPRSWPEHGAGPSKRRTMLASWSAAFPGASSIRALRGFLGTAAQRASYFLCQAHAAVPRRVANLLAAEPRPRTSAGHRGASSPRGPNRDRCGNFARTSRLLPKRAAR